MSARLRRPGNPVLTWCAANVVVEMDAGGNLTAGLPEVGAVTAMKIDGIGALAMAVGRCGDWGEGDGTEK